LRLLPLLRPFPANAFCSLDAESRPAPPAPLVSCFSNPFSPMIVFRLRVICQQLIEHFQVYRHTGGGCNVDDLSPIYT
jgi:hypothetical protein